MAKSDSADTRLTNSPKGRKYGDKTLEVTVRFFTDGIGGEKAVLQKNAWDIGSVYMKQNGLHWIRSGKAKPFNSILELPAVIADVLAAQGVVLHPGPKLKKILKTEEA